MNAIISLAVTLVTLPLLSETYSPKLLSQRASRLRHLTHNWALRSKSDEIETSITDFAERYLLRPLRMLVLEPILALITLYISVCFGESAQ